MGRLPGKLATLLLLAIGFGGLLAWIAMPTVFPDKTPILSDFLGTLSEQSKQLAPNGKLPVGLPPLSAGQQVILAMRPAGTTLGKDLDLSTRARATISRELAADGPELTVLYLVDDGEVRGRIPVSRCNLALSGNEPFVITSSSSRTAFIECGPVGDEPGECRDFHGLWNERCAARLVPR